MEDGPFRNLDPVDPATVRKSEPGDSPAWLVVREAATGRYRAGAVGRRPAGETREAYIGPPLPPPATLSLNRERLRHTLPTGLSAY